MPALRCASLHTVRIPEIFGARSGIFGAPLLAMGCAGSKTGSKLAGVESARARAGNAPTPQTQTNPMGVPFAEPVIPMAEPVIPMAAVVFSLPRVAGF